MSESSTGESAFEAPRYEGFGGTVRKIMGTSEPWWPPRARAEGKPNIVVVLVDDVGYSDVGCFGSEIDTPVLDSLAEVGLRFTNFHVNPMCSPTRASLLTGLNCHAIGFGHVANSDPGFPGYSCELPNDVSTLAETLRSAGYATLMTGKWHLAPEGDISASGPRHNWPCQRGFDRFYGILDAFTNVHHPHYLVEDNHVVDIDAYPDGYYLTDDLTDKAISLIKERKANDPGQPFFLYLAHPAPHAPLLAKPDDMAKYVDRYRAGWDNMRAERFARQVEMGLLPADTCLPPPNSEVGTGVAAWNTLSPEVRELYARYMAVFAGMIDNIDQNLGRLREALVAMGEWDNTILLFLSDNGASKEGEGVGTASYYNDLRPLPEDPDAARDTDLAVTDLIGSPRVMAHYPRGWAMVGNTPLRLYKTYAHAGGHQVPCVLHWPNGIANAHRGTMRRQYQHVIDVMPTLLDLAGVAPLADRYGWPARAMHGRSFAPALADATVAGRSEQHYELGGHRAYMREGWEAVAFHEPRTRFDDTGWELYSLADDMTQARDLATRHPEKVSELAAAWDRAARDNQIYPLDEGSGFRWVVRAPHAEPFETAITLWPGTPTLEPRRSRRLIWFKSFEVTVRCHVAAGDAGVLVAHGDQGGGYVLYIEGQHAWFAYNDGRNHMHEIDGGGLDVGDHSIVVSVTAKAGRLWDVVLSVDGAKRGELVEVRQTFPMAPFEGIDVGIDRRSPVSWELSRRHGPFPYSGRIVDVRYEPGALAPDAPSNLLPFIRQLAAQYE